MTRAQRLLELLQALRRRSRPVSAKALGEGLGVSYRTVYRDLAALTATGADIRGEPGVGFVMRRDGFLPPLQFTSDEENALFVGLNFAADRGDPSLRQGAINAAAKLRAVLESSTRPPLVEPIYLVAHVSLVQNPPTVDVLRSAIAMQRKVALSYCSLNGIAKNRTVWPLAIALMRDSMVAIVWCELADDYRHLRVDRIERLDLLEQRYRGSREQLLSGWRERENVPHRLDASPPEHRAEKSWSNCTDR